MDRRCRSSYTEVYRSVDSAVELGLVLNVRSIPVHILNFMITLSNYHYSKLLLTAQISWAWYYTNSYVKRNISVVCWDKLFGERI